MLSTSAKLLGAVISEDLRWNKHIRDNKQSLVTQLDSRLNALKRIARNSSFYTRRMVANGLVLSKLVYLINIWGGAPQYLLKTLYVQQMHAARVVCGFQCWGWSNRRVLNKVGWLSIRQLLFYHAVLQAQKTVSTRIPLPLFNSIVKEHPYNTRNASVGNIRYSEGFTNEQVTFKGRARSWYNQVPIDIRTDGSLQTQKKKLKKWISKNVPADW